MVEKPMALDLPQSRELVDLAEQNKKILSVFHCRRWDIDYLTVKSAIDAGVFGKVFNIESRIGQWSSCVGPAAKEWRPGWRNEASFGGGGLYDWGSHFIDQLWRLLFPAKPIRVFAQLRGNVWSKDCDDFARVCIDFDNDAVGMVEINTTTTRPLPRWHIDGTLGSADAPFSLAFDLNVWSQITFTGADGGEPRLLEKSQAVMLTKTQIWDQFASAVRGQGGPAVSANSVLTTMKLLDAARESSRTGRVVSF
jgi:predicted dehydrogenase